MLLYYIIYSLPTPSETKDDNAEENQEATETGTENREDKEEETTAEEQQQNQNEEGMWEETFKTHHDSKPHGMYFLLYQSDSYYYNSNL